MPRFTSLICSTLLILCLYSTPAFASEGAAIGSSGFNAMLDKQAKPNMFTTEQQAGGSFLLKNTMQTVSAKITAQGVAFDSIGNSAGKGGFGLQLAQWGRAGALQAAPCTQGASLLKWAIRYPLIMW